MAKRRKATHTRKRRHNPTHSRKRHSSRRRNPLFAARRRRSVKRRSNPSIGGLLPDAIAATIGGKLTQIVRPMIPIGGGGGLVDVAVTLGVAYGLGVLAEKVQFTRPYAKMITVGGFVVAVAQALPSVTGLVGSIAGSAARPAPKQAEGMSGIAYLPPGTNPFGSYGMSGVAHYSA